MNGKGTKEKDGKGSDIPGVILRGIELNENEAKDM